DILIWSRYCNLNIHSNCHIQMTSAFLLINSEFLSTEEVMNKLKEIPEIVDFTVCFKPEVANPNFTHKSIAN
ncbi:MAG: hypothetical protein WAM88_12625, partial [Nitrososphaeraceae archaeon]